jgi:hypothetical protein
MLVLWLNALCTFSQLGSWPTCDFWLFVFWYISLILGFCLSLSSSATSCGELAGVSTPWSREREFTRRAKTPLEEDGSTLDGWPVTFGTPPDVRSGA